MSERVDFRGRRYAECRRCGVKWYLHEPVPPGGFVCPICQKKERCAGAVPKTDTKH